jgi:hypothetical protein
MKYLILCIFLIGCDDTKGYCGYTGNSPCPYLVDAGEPDTSPVRFHMSAEDWMMTW